MNGAQAAVRTLVDAGVDTCFMNPGTSELHLVAALDAVPGVRGVLALFEGVATGAADGYARMRDRPAVALLHLGPGLGNGLANLHNARRARSPVVALVGEHATYHQRYDAPLQSDIESIARGVSGWVRRSAGTQTLADDVAAAVAAAIGPPGRVATLILPADLLWSEGGRPATAPPAAAPRAVIPPAGGPRPVDEASIAAAAEVLRSGKPGVLLLGGRALHEPGLRSAARIAAATGATLLGETFPARMQRGAGLPVVHRLAYLPEMVDAQLDGAAHLVLAGARSPVTFFAYPGRPSDLVPPGCQVHQLTTVDDGVVPALDALAEWLGAAEVPMPRAPETPRRPSGPIDAGTFAAAIAATLPEGAVVVDESNTSGVGLAAATAGSARHDVLALTGGATGYGLPAALGAAVAAPDRPVLCLEADGSAMYTIQALWTQAREGANVTTVVLNNSSYAILRMELARVAAAAAGQAGAAAGQAGTAAGQAGTAAGVSAGQAAAMLELSRPDLDFGALARGMGVPAVRVDTAEDLTAEVERGLAEPGPYLVEAMIQPRP